MPEKLHFGLFDWIEGSAERRPVDVYEHKLQLAAAADRAGFHCYFIAEHTGTPLSINGSPAVVMHHLTRKHEGMKAFPSFSGD
jgi:alkanesulfonate monooxygenase SsuD/methylene tetrahydromethanopterin reductase-like flavin-dependent oxidoreductase (luciferase family)